MRGRLAVRCLERELYDYPSCKKEIERLLEEQAWPENPWGTLVPPSKNRPPSDPTPQAASALIYSRRLRRLQETVQAVEELLGLLPEDMREFVRCRYFERMSRDQVCDAQAITQATYYRWRRAVLHRFAELVGMVAPEAEAAFISAIG